MTRGAHAVRQSPADRSKRTQRLLGWLRVPLIAAMAIAAMPDQLFFVRGVPWYVRYPTRGALAGGAVILLMLHCKYWIASRQRNLPESLPLNEVDEDYKPETLTVSQLNELSARHWAGELTPELAKVVLGRLISPARYRSHIVETIAVGPTVARRQVRIEFLGSLHPDSRVEYLPYARPRKGHVLDNLLVEDARGRYVPTLSYMRTYTLLWALAATEFRRTMRAETTADDEEEFYVALAQAIADHNSSKIRAKLIALVRLHCVGDDETRMDFYRLIDLCAYNRPLIAMLADHGERIPLELRYSHDETLGRSAVSVSGVDRFAELKQWIRRSRNIPVTQIAFEAFKSRAAGSYQVRIVAPDGFYISDAVVWNHGVHGRPAPNLQHGQRYRRFISWQTNIDQRTTHVHTANLAGSSMKFPYVVVELREIPPGSVGRSTVAALITLATIWICAVVFPGIPTAPESAKSTTSTASRSATTPASSARIGASQPAPQHLFTPGTNTPTAATLSAAATAQAATTDATTQDDQATDVVAFILGVPAVLGAWLALGVNRQRGFASLSARISLGLSAILSVASAALYLLHVRHPNYAVAWPHGENVLFVQEVSWSVLLVIALLNLAAIGGILRIRNRRYNTERNVVSLDIRAP